MLERMYVRRVQKIRLQPRANQGKVESRTMVKTVIRVPREPVKRIPEGTLQSGARFENVSTRIPCRALNHR